MPYIWQAFASIYVYVCIFFNENVCYFIYISLNDVPESPIDSKWAMVHVMAAQFNDTYE